MKKIIIPILPLLMLTNCGGTDNLNELSILSPTGAPSLCFYSYANNEKFITTSNPQNGIIPMFIKGEYDVIVAPTQGGLNQIINQKVNYQIAATITFGNFYIISTGRDSDNEMNAGDKVLLFQENDLPGRIFNFLYGDLNLWTYSVASAALTKSVIENNGILKDETNIEFDYIFTAEPVVTTTNSTIFKNVQNDFNNKTDGKILTQASIFIKKNANRTKVLSFLNKIKSDVDKCLINPSIVQTSLEALGSPEAQQGKYGVSGAIAKKIIENGNKFSLGFQNAFDIKNDLQQFVDLFPNLNLGILNEEIFYK